MKRQTKQNDRQHKIVKQMTQKERQHRKTKIVIKMWTDKQNTDRQTLLGNYNICFILFLAKTKRHFQFRFQHRLF
jgi:hypothetical protein